MRKYSENDYKAKDILEKSKTGNLNDEIEMKDIEIKDSLKKLDKIKTSSLKEFIYSNKKIPDSWKNKLNYQTKVLEIFAKDRNFLLYVGNGGSEKNDSNKIRLKTVKDKIKFRNYRKPLSLIPKSGNMNLSNGNFKENNLTTSNNYSSLNIQRKIKKQRNKSLNEKELNNILEQLQNDFPIKDKLVELFPDKLLKSIDMKNKNIKDNRNNNCLNKYIYQTIKPEKRRNIFRQNIFVNLVQSKPKIKKNKTLRIQSAYISNENKKYDNIFVKKKYKIKNETIKKQLESINFFGPYYSYCPPCGNRNVDFYKNLDNNKLIQIVQQIKKMKGKGIYGNLSERTRKSTKMI